MGRYVQIVDDWENESVETIDVTSRSQKYIQKLVDGIEINLNHEHYTVHVTDDTSKFEEQHDNN